MQLISINVMSDSRATSKCTGVVLRSNKTGRLVYYPKLVRASSNPEKIVSGKLIYQKKKTSEDWSDQDSISLNNLKAGEWTKVDLSRDDLFELISISGELKKMYEDADLSFGNNDYYFLREQHLLFNSNIEKDKELVNKVLRFAKKTELNDLIDLLSGDNIEDITATLKLINPEILLKVSESPESVKAYLENKDNIDLLLEKFDIEKLQELNSKIGRSILELAIEDFETLIGGSPSEPECQEFFTTNSFLLPLVIPTTCHMIGEDRFTGGTKISGKGSTFTDFIAKWNDQVVSVIEIKKPTTPLLKTNAYRPDTVFGPSNELSGSITQVCIQRFNFIIDLPVRNTHSDYQTKAYRPIAYVIIGRLDEIVGIDREKSFELFRNSFSDVVVITYDEVLARLKNLTQVLSN